MTKKKDVSTRQSSPSPIRRTGSPRTQPDSSAHTPGPWAWSGTPGHSELSAAGGQKVIDYAAYEGMWLAAYDDERDAANARLIAAAPDLLKALRGMVEWFAMERNVAPVAAAYAAIAKADGVR